MRNLLSMHLAYQYGVSAMESVIREMRRLGNRAWEIVDGA